jgi:hypothetical protein
VTPEQLAMYNLALAACEIQSQDVIALAFSGPGSAPTSVKLVTSGGLEVRYPIDTRTQQLLWFRDIDAGDIVAKAEIATHTQAIQDLEEERVTLEIRRDRVRRGLSGAPQPGE